jgi:hypothetical protein
MVQNYERKFNMKRSKKGNWILEDERYQYMAYIEKAEIVEIKAYSPGFRSIEVKVQKYNAKEGRVKEMTWADDYFKQISWSSKEEVMKFLLLYYKNRPTLPKVAKKLISYREHLIANFPEMLI